MGGRQICEGFAQILRRFCGDSAADIRRAINLRRSCGREILRRFCEDFAEILRELGGRDFCADFAENLRRSRLQQESGGSSLAFLGVLRDDSDDEVSSLTSSDTLLDDVLFWKELDM